MDIASKLSSDFQKFALQNNIIASTAGFTIGLATKDLIDKTLRRFNFGSSAELLTSLFGKKGAKPTVDPASPLGVSLGILCDLFIWLGVIGMTFLIATYIMSRFIIPRVQSALHATPAQASKDDVNEHQRVL
jgi:large-conductance mechanosensitive channel